MPIYCIATKEPEPCPVCDKQAPTILDILAARECNHHELYGSCILARGHDSTRRFLHYQLQEYELLVDEFDLNKYDLDRFNLYIEELRRLVVVIDATDHEVALIKLDNYDVVAYAALTRGEEQGYVSKLGEVP